MGPPSTQLAALVWSLFPSAAGSSSLAVSSGGALSFAGQRAAASLCQSHGAVYIYTCMPVLYAGNDTSLVDGITGGSRYLATCMDDMMML